MSCKFYSHVIVKIFKEKYYSQATAMEVTEPGIV